MTGQERVREKLVELTGYLSDLKAQRGLSWEESQRNTMLKRGIERTQQMAIECLLDIGGILIAARRWRAPQSDRDVFQVLAEQGVLSAEEVQTHTKMAGFRNILVHKYTQVDAAIVFGGLKQGTADLERFRDRVLTYLGLTP